MLVIVGCVALYVLLMVIVYKVMADIADDDEAYKIIMKALRKKLK